MSFTEKLSLEKKPKPEKLPVVWVMNAKNVGTLNSLKGIAEKINPDYEVHSFKSHEGQIILNAMIGLTGNLNYPDILLLSVPINNTNVKDNVTTASKGKTVVVTTDTSIGVPHAVTPEKIEAGKKEWETQFSGIPEPKIAVLLGGNCPNFEFTPEKARKMAKECVQKAKELGGSMIITTSPRTGKEASEAFMDEIKNEYDVPAYLHDWRMDAAKGNPYFRILGLADAIIVGGDSASMCSEANMSRKPVYIYAPDGTREIDAKLHQQLYARNLAKPFYEFLEKGIVHWEYEPLDTADDIAREALKRFQELEKKKSTHYL